MEKKKVGFASGIGFILAAAGSAVGLGNLWGFPYKTSANGGAAFVLIYVACVLFIGVIAMITEMFIGKRAKANPITAFKKVNKNYGWVGIVAIVVPTVINFYYTILGGWTLKFAMNSFNGNAGNLANFSGNAGEVILYTGIFIALALVIVMGGVKGGIEKASKVLMPALFIILVALVVYALTLGEGVSDGLAFYLKPDFSVVTGSSILAAMGQAFYSLSLGMGIMITYGSYTGKEINLLRSTAMICIFDSLVALLGGLAIFPSMFHYIATAGVAAADLGMGGMGLMFQTLPMVFEGMGGIGQIVSFAFFAMVTIAAVTSVISLMEVTTQFVIQKFHVFRKKAAFVVALITFAVSIPIGISLGAAFNGGTTMFVFGMDLLSLLDTITNTVLMPICALLSCIAVGWLIGPKKACDEIEAEGTKMGKFRGIYSFMLKFISPLLIIIVEIFGIRDLLFPAGEAGRAFSSNGCGVVVVSAAIIVLSIIAYFLFLRNAKTTGTNDDEIIVDAAELEAEQAHKKKK